MNTGISSVRKHRTLIVRELFQIGFGKKEIIESTNFSIAQINYDLQSFDTKELHHDRPIGRLQKNMSILKSFASLDTKGGRELSDAEKEILTILKNKVFYEKMKDVVTGMLNTLDYIGSFELHDDFSKEYAPYARLKKELSLKESTSIRENADRTQALLRNFFRSIAKDDTRHKLNSLEVTKDHPLYDYIDFVINQRKNFLMNNWNGEKFRKDIDSVTQWIPSDELKIINLYFGFEGEPYTLEKVAAALSLKISRQAVQQKKEAILTNIRELLFRKYQTEEVIGK